MNALMDTFRVLFDPVAVFERQREKSSVLMPFLVIAVVQIVLGVLNLPYIQVALKAQMAARGAAAPAGGPDPSSFAWIGIVFAPIGIFIFLLVATLIVWVLVSIFGGEGKFAMLLSVTTHAAVPSVILMAIIGAVVLRMRGPDTITSFMDLQPALGLDLLAPGTTGFMGAVLKGINPFAIWGLVIQAIGISVTHKLPRSTGYTVATISFVIGLAVGAALSGMGGPR